MVPCEQGLRVDIKDLMSRKRVVGARDGKLCVPRSSLALIYRL